MVTGLTLLPIFAPSQAEAIGRIVVPVARSPDPAAAPLVAIADRRRKRVPVPRPKPTLTDEGAGPIDPELSGEKREAAGPVTEEPAPVVRPPFDSEAASTCEAVLAGRGVTYRVLPASAEDGSWCGWPRPLEVSAIDGVTLRPSVEVRCDVALALADWLEHVVVPSAALHLDGARPSAVLTSGSYQCRRVNGSGRISEHATANAVDIAGLLFDKGRTMTVGETAKEGDVGTIAFQAAIRGGACALFTTVLGPGSNEDHSGHLHVDLAERKGGYRLCQ